MDKNFRRTFSICPVCGGTHRFCEELGQELKDRGLARPEWNMRFDSRQGMVIDPSKAILMPVGISLPGFSIVTDICMDCGAIYAVELSRLEGKTSAMRPPRDIAPSQFSRS